MAKEDKLDSTEDIIDLVDIVQNSKENNARDGAHVDFDDELSNLLAESGSPSRKVESFYSSDPKKLISLDEAPDLDTLLLEERPPRTSKSIGNDDSKTEGEASPIEDLDSLLDSLFSTEEESKPSKTIHADDLLSFENSDSGKNSVESISKISRAKGAFLESALSGLDGLDEVLSKSDKNTLNIESQSSESKDKKLEISSEDTSLSGLDEIEAILDEAMVEPVVLNKNDTSILENKEGTLVQAEKDSSIGVTENNTSPVGVDSSTAVLGNTKEDGSEQILEEIRVLSQRISTLELVLLGHEVDVEGTQESNSIEGKDLEEQGKKGFKAEIIEALTEEIFTRMQKDIDKVASKAAAQVIREEIAAMEQERFADPSGNKNS